MVKKLTLFAMQFSCQRSLALGSAIVLPILARQL
jgi:hypothetical protein